jgi:predicted TIM-barrel fold metal-dependent hydrolase
VSAPLQPPASDAEVPGYTAALGLPGLVDVHVHFLPPRMLEKVWAYFDAGADHYGVPWPVHYRQSEVDRLARLRELGVLRFTSLVYPHKAGMADWLNGWAADFAARTPDCVRSGTFYPEPGVDSYVRKALDDGVGIFKVHLQVGGYDPRDPLLEPVWGMLAESGVPVVTHCGGGPLPGAFTGPGPIGAVLAAHPGLTLVVAHAGMPEYLDFADLAEKYPNVHLDTTMVGTPFTEALLPMPAELPARFADLGDKVILGSDFPNIPYAYSEQIAALHRLDLGADWLRAVLYDNGARLLGAAPAAP